MQKKYLIMSILIILIMVLLTSGGLYNKHYQKKDNSYLAILVNGSEQSSIPARGNYDVSISCNNGKGRWNYDAWEAEIEDVTSTTKCTLSFTNETPISLNDYIKSLSKGNGTSNSTGVWNEPATDYRYEGKNPNNYIWFNNELWRIIGVFDDSTHEKTGEELVKIIRATAIGGLAWQKNNSNNWEHATSSLKKLLNDHYYKGSNESSITHCYTYSTTISGNCDFTKNGITDSTYRNMIEEVTWKLGGRADTTANSSTFYSAERGTTVPTGASATGTGYIGLMYPSDYGYSVLANSCARTTNLGSYSTNACGGSSWLYGTGLYEWTITPFSGNTAYVFSVYYSGHLNSNLAYSGYSVRPVLYLKSDTMKYAGTGTVNNPYIISR